MADENLAKSDISIFNEILKWLKILWFKCYESILSSKYNDRSSKDERKEDILIMSLLNFLNIVIKG